MSNASSYSVTLAAIASDITLYLDIATLIFGIIGSIGNLITFSGRQMRRSSPIFYLLCATVFQFFTILFCVITRLTVDRSGGILQNQSTIFCKLRYYLVVTLPALASYYVCLAALDRCLLSSTNANIRAWSNIKIAKRVAAATFIIGSVMSIHILIFYDIYNNLCRIVPGSIYRFIFAGYLVIIVSLLPNLLILIFSLITISALRKTQQRIAPRVTMNHTSNHQRVPRLGSRIINIIMVQGIVSTSLVLLRLGSYSYNIIVENIWNRTANERAPTVFAITVGGSLYFFSYATSFYVSILSSRFFRNAFYENLLFIKHYCTGRRLHGNIGQ